MKELGDLIERNLDGSDYDQGELEDMQQTIYNLKDSLATLLSIMFDKKQLNKNQLKEIIGYIRYDDKEKFEELTGE